MPDERRSSPDLYESDFVAWSELQAELVRTGRFAELDIENVAEELESLARTDKRALRSHLKNVLMHLLKWVHQPERRSESWTNSISNGRYEADLLVEESPSLRPQLPALIASAYEDAVRFAVRETGLPKKTFPAECPWTPEQVLDQDFMP